MALNFKLEVQALSRLRRMPSAKFVLQALACAVVAWSLWRDGVSVAPASDPAPQRQAPSPAAVKPAPTAAAAAQPASLPALDGARLALSSIDVVVSRNDTLDRIFRRLKLNLADLATLRGLPGVRASLDTLRPGESLRFTHRDGELMGLERRISENQTLKVSRDDGALKADVLQNALELRPRTIHGVIDSSLFEAVQAAGGRDPLAVQLADIFGWDIDFVLDVRPGDRFVVSYNQIWREGSYVKDGPIEAAEFVNQGRDFRAVRYTDPQGGTHYYT